MSISNKVIASKLSFKGDNSTAKKKKIKRTSEALEEAPIIDPVVEVDDIKVVPGTGRITSSSTTIHGHYTSFMTELSVGDAIVVTHPTTLQDETKIVRMVLSNVSMSISTAFSTDLISTTPFQYIKAPKDKVAEEINEKNEQATKIRKTEQAAFGTYASNGGETFVYRVKKEGSFGGYKIVSESLTENKTREDLLDMRTKKKSDRFCY